MCIVCFVCMPPMMERPLSSVTPLTFSDQLFSGVRSCCSVRGSQEYWIYESCPKFWRDIFVTWHVTNWHLWPDMSPSNTRVTWHVTRWQLFPTISFQDGSLIFCCFHNCNVIPRTKMAACAEERVRTPLEVTADSLGVLHATIKVCVDWLWIGASGCCLEITFDQWICQSLLVTWVNEVCLIEVFSVLCVTQPQFV